MQVLALAQDAVAPLVGLLVKIYGLKGGGWCWARGEALVATQASGLSCLLGVPALLLHGVHWWGVDSEEGDVLELLTVQAVAERLVELFAALRLGRFPLLFPSRALVGAKLEASKVAQSASSCRRKYRRNNEQFHDIESQFRLEACKHHGMISDT